jgi:hypothetical protein
MSSRSKKILPYPISANTGILSSTKQKDAALQYYSKFLAMYYIDLMYNFLDVFTNCCIGILQRHINFMGYVRTHVLFNNNTIVTNFFILNEKIVKDRYVYVEKHWEIIDVNAEKEVLAIHFLEKKRVLSDFMANGYYYKELQDVMGLKRGAIKKQFTDISYILNNPEFDDDLKKQKIQEYIDKRNKKFASKIDFQLKFIPLESIENKIRSIEIYIAAIEKCFSDNWSVNGKKAFDEYQRYKIARVKGGKCKRKRKKIKGGVFGNFFSRFFSKKVAPIPVDYIAVINKYKNNQTHKLKEIYNLLEEIIFYSLDHIEIAHAEYSYLTELDSRYIQRTENGISRLYKLNNAEKDYIYMLNIRLEPDIKHNFVILKRRYTELENTLSMSFPNEPV